MILSELKKKSKGLNKNKKNTITHGRMRPIKEHYNQFSGNESGTVMGLSIAAFVVMVLIWLFLFIAAIYFIFTCSEIKQWASWVPLLLIILMLIPGIGGIVALAIIIFGLISCGK